MLLFNSVSLCGSLLILPVLVTFARWRPKFKLKCLPPLIFLAKLYRSNVVVSYVTLKPLEMEMLSQSYVIQERRKENYNVRELQAPLQRHSDDSGLSGYESILGLLARAHPDEFTHNEWWRR